MLEYISAPEAAKKWGISERRVQAMRRKTHTRSGKIESHVADTRGRGKAQRLMEFR